MINTIHIIESTSRFKDIEGFKDGLETMGFDIVSVKDMGKFTYFYGLNSGDGENIQLKF